MRIRGGMIITDQGPSAAEIHLRDGKILAVTRPEDSPSATNPEEAVVDATGLWVLPGGVDVHTHFGMPLPSGLTSLGWRESSEAALLGGTTTIIDFANPEPGEPLQAATDRWRDLAAKDCLCDFGLHVTVSQATPARLAEIPFLVEVGLPTFKGFLAYKDRLMLTATAMEQLMNAVARAKGMLLVHAEDGLMVDKAQEILVGTGRTAPHWHPLAHPPEAEEQAVAQTLDLSLQTGCPLTLVHLSLGGSVQLLEEARRRRDQAALPVPLYGEVCLHHLFASAEIYTAGHAAALAAILSPPLRPPAAGRDLQAALAEGRLDWLATDHCEFPLSVKAEAAAGGFAAVPNGAGGVGERLVIGFQRGVTEGEMTPVRWQDTCCRCPAEAMGLGHRKGRLAAGFDADIVLFDPAATYRWEPLGRSDRAGSLWAGTPCKGMVRDVWLRGCRVVSGGRLVPQQPGGEFLPRTLTRDGSQ